MQEGDDTLGMMIELGQGSTVASEGAAIVKEDHPTLQMVSLRVNFFVNVTCPSG